MNKKKEIDYKLAFLSVCGIIACIVITLMINQ